MVDREFISNTSVSNMVENKRNLEMKLLENNLLIKRFNQHIDKLQKENKEIESKLEVINE